MIVYHMHASDCHQVKTGYNTLLNLQTKITCN